jgi:hypothetical protein
MSPIPDVPPVINTTLPSTENNSWSVTRRHPASTPRAGVTVSGEESLGTQT